MDMNKQLALIFEYKNAPKSLQDVATLHRANSNALTKKAAQVKAAQIELDTLQRQYNESAKGFEAELNAWQPTGV